MMAADRLGDGTSLDNSDVPVQVMGLTEGVVTAISAGEAHSCAVMNGRAMCWGMNSEGQLGDNTRADSETPVQVDGLLSGVTTISAGANET